MSSRNRSEEMAARYAASPAGIAGAEKKRLKQMDLLAAGVAPEDLVSKKVSRKDYGSDKEHQAARYQARCRKIAPELAAKYAAKAPELAAKYAADKDANDALCRAAQAAAGFSAEELGPSYEEMKQQIDSQFEWGDGWVKITDVDGQVWSFEGLRWHRAYIAIDEPDRISIESVRPFRKTGQYEPWLVQTKVVEGVHVKIGKHYFLQNLLQCRLKMYVSRVRGPSRLAEKAVGRNTKHGGWPPTAIKDGVFIRSSLSLFTRSAVFGVIVVYYESMKRKLICNAQVAPVATSLKRGAS